MSSKKQYNPLQDLKMDLLLTEISEHYGWELLSRTLDIEKFLFHTGMKSTINFLRKNEWAKDKVENFYLYQYKNLPFPDDKQLSIAPRNRLITIKPEDLKPAEITETSLFQIDKASRLRSYKNAKHELNKSSQYKEEPAFNPDNPWNQ